MTTLPKPLYSFGSRLKLQLNVMGIRANQLEKMTGLSQTTISHFIRGNRNPSLKNIQKILLFMPEADARWLIVGDKNDIT